MSTILDAAWQRAKCLAARERPNPRLLLSAVVDLLADASRDPRGMSARTCHDLARMMDEAMVRDAQAAPVVVVIGRAGR
ncbi:MAG: hypothetical protein KGS47_16975 [Chloroflexi bacterium]|nr:hypothetical protein [Chloroflexota bacterium]